MVSGISGANSVNDVPPALAMRNHFMGWQCRLRQYAMRQDGGRPGTGMCPEVALGKESRPLGRIIVLIVKREPESSAAEFRHMCKRTLDPSNRYSSAIQYLSAAYYQQPETFDDEMTALFGVDSQVAAALTAEGGCVLSFSQYSQSYSLSCRVRTLEESEPAFQATYWHNLLFNPELPGDVRVLGIQPDWTTAIAEPEISRG